MVVLAASVVTKSGKALLSRQFVDMTRIRIEGLLAAFPKLVGSGKQHTYVETENVRYVYQPLEGLYLLLVTNKQSNILEDLETLRLLSKLVPEFCTQMDEEGIVRSAFELIFAFDEVISEGHKENVTVAQVRTFTEMESHEEKLHKMIIQSKVNDTKDIMKRKASEIDKTKMDKAKGDRPNFSNGSFGISSDRPAPKSEPFIASPIGGFAEINAPAAPTSGQGKGMQLGKSTTKAKQFLESLRAEGEIVEAEGSSRPAAGSTIVQAASDPITIAIEEVLNIVIKKDGGLENFEVQGTMALEVVREEDAYIRIKVEAGDNPGFQFKTHPNIDKALHSQQSILGLKDSSRPFPTGSALGVLKWRMQCKDESMIPFTVNCWPSASGNETYVNIEYESTSQFELHKVLVTIPVPPARDPPSVNQVDGDFRYDARKGVLEWQIELIDNTNRSGAMEFVVHTAASTNAFFPVDIKFSSNKTFCDVKVAGVFSTSDNSPAKFASRTSLAVDSYQVV
eukprot:jgi/Chlat1/8377/Chrsp80S00644